MIACLRHPHLIAYSAGEVLNQEAGSLLVVDKGRVLDCGPHALHGGVRPGMPLRRARAICPQARAVDTARVPYQELLGAVVDELATLTPRVEVAVHPGEVRVYLGLAHLRGDTLLEAVQQAVWVARERTGRGVALGLARGRFTAQVAAFAAEVNEGILLAPGRDRAFLALFPVTLLPLEEEMARQLHLLGLRTMGQLAALPPRAVLARFGRAGLFLLRLARGEDDRPVRPLGRPPVVRAAREPERPLNDRQALAHLLADLAWELAWRLAADRLAARRVRLTLHQENGDSLTREVVVRRPTAAAPHLARVLTELAATVRVTAGVEGVTAVLTDLVPQVSEQMALLPEVTQANPWGEILADLVARYGRECFYRVALVNPEAPLVEERFRLEEVSGG